MPNSDFALEAGQHVHSLFYHYYYYYNYYYYTS